MGSLIPIAQEFEDAILIVGGAMCAASLAFSGKQRIGMMMTGGLLVVATIVVILLTFKAGAS